MTTPFHMKRQVQFAETDLAGVLHFANYYRFMEEAEHAFLRSLGLSVITEHEGQEISWPRVSTGCEYFSAVAFEDEIDLAVRVGELGRSSVSYEIEFTIGDRRIALGHTKAVCCTMVKGVFTSIPIPPQIRETLAEAAKGA